ncbi:uncharacterized protein An11g04070 [Aspergillus niger]|uniref:Contig An11c0150, genomic contig n=2 Tax=Aspergillus niger TaxID=5061 RepID=A2QW69_ASPNC|nr:uncharacterized protein An11g04070 [Aspergillus niger]CAK48392.1 unnamed protein product [Aspergillus niger]
MVRLWSLRKDESGRSVLLYRVCREVSATSFSSQSGIRRVPTWGWNFLVWKVLNVGLKIYRVTRQTLQELLYFHKDLNIIHDNLKCSEVIITLDGDVKIGNSPSDVQNVCEIARLLRERDDSVCGPVRLLAQGLIGVLLTTAAETHLDVWPVPTSHSIAQQKKAQ